MVTVSQLLDLTHTAAGEYLRSFRFPWEALEGIPQLIVSLGSRLGDDYEQLAPQIWVHRTAVVAPTAFLGGPCIIGPRTEVRHCAFVRTAALIGQDCVVGNSTEIKNAILFDNVEVPHYNYVGDSILGYHAHLGAGAVTSNVKSDRSTVKITLDGVRMDTNRHKVGAVVGDFAEVGCNSVLNPGTIVGRNASIYPTCCVRGIVLSDCILKADGSMVRKI